MQKNVHEHRGIYHLTNIYRNARVRIGSHLNINVTIGDCIHCSWDLKFVDKVIHENNENWIPMNKKYFTVNTFAYYFLKSVLF